MPAVDSIACETRAHARGAEQETIKGNSKAAGQCATNRVRLQIIGSFVPLAKLVIHYASDLKRGAHAWWLSRYNRVLSNWSSTARDAVTREFRAPSI
jgi:hypothetical protein